MTMTPWHTPKTVAIPLVQERTPQLQHIRDHMRGVLNDRDEGVLDDYMTIVRALCEPKTLDQIAEGMGFHWNGEMVRYRLTKLRDVLVLRAPVASGPDSYLSRLALARRVWGIDPCWCDF